MKTGRNQPCPCGGGLKYKRCCGTPKRGVPIELRCSVCHKQIVGDNAATVRVECEAGHAAIAHAGCQNGLAAWVETHPLCGFCDAPWRREGEHNHDHAHDHDNDRPPGGTP